MNRMSPPARRIVVALAALWVAAAAAPVAAQAQPSYAVLSLVGDKLTLAHPRSTVESSINRQPRQEFPVADDSLDGVAALAAGAAIKRAQPGASTSLFTTRDAKLFALQDQLVESNELSAELGQSLKALLADAKATHFLLITKFRADARLKLRIESVGTGRLTGLGFYLDRHFETINHETGHTSVGFLSPFAYVRVSLIDAATLKPLRQTTMRESDLVVSEPGAKDHLWQTLSSERKARMLENLLRHTVDEATTHLMEASAAR